MRPPRPLLLGAVVSVAAGLVLLSAPGFVWRIVGYALASFATIGLVTVFKWVDVRRRLDPHYFPSPALGRLIPLVTVLGVAVAAAHVWGLATELSD